MSLTSKVESAVERGQAVPVTVGGAECVLVGKAVYERLQTLVEASSRETYPSVLRSIDKDDENTDQYLGVPQ